MADKRRGGHKKREQQEGRQERNCWYQMKRSEMAGAALGKSNKGNKMTKTKAWSVARRLKVRM